MKKDPNTKAQDKRGRGVLSDWAEEVQARIQAEIAERGEETLGLMDRFAIICKHTKAVRQERNLKSSKPHPLTEDQVALLYEMMKAAQDSDTALAANDLQGTLRHCARCEKAAEKLKQTFAARRGAYTSVQEGGRSDG